MVFSFFAITQLFFAIKTLMYFSFILTTTVLSLSFFLPYFCHFSVFSASFLSAQRLFPLFRFTSLFVTLFTFCFYFARFTSLTICCSLFLHYINPNEMCLLLLFLCIILLDISLFPSTTRNDALKTTQTNTKKHCTDDWRQQSEEETTKNSYTFFLNAMREFNVCFFSCYCCCKRRQFLDSFIYVLLFSGVFDT